ncbi:lipocalin-like domain-containing protein [Nibricoccus sp. IMCC34717]|uniref:lipocalin-like domain-containing protein n=1 Tax=Nibricoccus sp. IMCC34717 TaxID=3034021 RepID=UPI00384C77A5
MRIVSKVLILILSVSLGASAAGSVNSEGFDVPQPGRVFTFPRDHASHPTFKIEWWYLTGHLFDASGQQRGFQATFFRRAYRPDSSETPAHLFLAHMALSDPATGRFLHQERLARADWDAMADTNDLAVRNGPWSLHRIDGTPEVFVVEGGVRADASWSLRLTPVKPLVIFGEQGVSRKGSDADAASHYLTFPRLSVSGTLRLDGKELAVTGEAWLDHEFSSSQLSTGQVGWDWAGIQLADGREIMLYRLRRSDGSADPASKLCWVSQYSEQAVRPFNWTVLEDWRSPATGITYPARIQISTTDPASEKPATLVLKPLLVAQELVGQRGGVTYWEGSCDVLDTEGRMIGRAYLELTGYGGQLRM